MTIALWPDRNDAAIITRRRHLWRRLASGDGEREQDSVVIAVG